MMNLKPKVLFFSGAGLSAGSGIPTFRDTDGLWEKYDLDMVCNESTWKKNRKLVHEFYSSRRMALNSVKPNKAHELISQYQKDTRFDIINITQNVDDLLERAGCDNVLHVHGKLTEMKCESCGNIWDIGYVEWTENDKCPKCDSVKGVRPNIVMFGGVALNYSKMYKAFESLSTFDNVIMIGTSGSVIPPKYILSRCKNTPAFLFTLDIAQCDNKELFTDIIIGPVENTLEDKFNELIAYIDVLLSST